MDDKKLNNGWNEWSRRVLGDIERIDKKVDDLVTQINKLAIEIAVLKTKAAMIAGVWGAVLGIAASVITSFLLKGK